MDVEFRDINEDDYPSLRLLIGRSFRKSDDTKKDDISMNAFLDLILVEILSRSNYTRVATDKDKIIGFIAGRCNKISSPSIIIDYQKIFDNDITLIKKSSKWNRKLRYHQRMKNTCVELLKRYDNDFDGELVAFYINNEYREKGIGHTLISDFRSFIFQNGGEYYCILSDYYDERVHNGTGVDLIDKMKMRSSYIFNDYIYLCSSKK